MSVDYNAVRNGDVLILWCDKCQVHYDAPGPHAKSHADHVDDTQFNCGSSCGGTRCVMRGYKPTLGRSKVK